MNVLVEASNRFAPDLFKEQMKERSGRNMISSPLSVVAGIAMLFLGSRGKTADQIRQILQNIPTETLSPSDVRLSGTECDKPGGFHSWFKQLLSTVNQHSKQHTLKIANRLYGSNSLDFLKQYLQCVIELYNSDLEKVDFTNPDECRQKINSWVERQTNGDITNLFPVNSIGQSTAMVLANAISFKGLWKIPFNPKDTHKALFWTSKDQSTYVDMMTRNGIFNIANISNPPMQVLELPFDDMLCMYIFLPDNDVTTDEIIKQLTYEKLQEWTSSESMKSEATTIYFPKFRLADEYSLKPILSRMGIRDLFIPGKADLSGISGNHDLAVSQIHHKAFIEVNEEGTTEAAASTHEVFILGSQSVVRVNKPFLYHVSLTEFKTTLFIGRINLPHEEILP